MEEEWEAMENDEKYAPKGTVGPFANHVTCTAADFPVEGEEAVAATKKSIESVKGSFCSSLDSL